MNEVRVTRNENGAFEVWQGAKTSGQLCMGEMLEHVLKLLVPELPGPRYAMETPATWKRRFEGNFKP